jgi:hypothetical protein
MCSGSTTPGYSTSPSGKSGNDVAGTRPM